MENRVLNISKRGWMRIVLVSVFFVIIAFSHFGEKVAMNDGIGYDGENYLLSIRQFSSLIFSHGYDQYAIQRIMPWGAVHYVFRLCNIEPTSHNALIAGGIINVIVLALAMFFFFRISDLKKWKLSTEIIAFSSLFYSYALLKVSGYVILSNDRIAFLWGMMYVYYFLADRKFILLLLALLGAVNWPGVALICGLALFFLPKNELPLQSTLSGLDKMAYYLLLIGLASLPLLYQMVSLIVPPNHNVHMFDLDGRPETNIVYFGISVLCSCLFLFYMIQPFRISFTKTWKSFNRWKSWIGLAAFLIAYIGVGKVLDMLANNGEVTFSTKALIHNVMVSGTIDPFNFVESFFSFFGPIVLLVILLWNNSAKYITQKGLGYFFVIALAIFFSIRPEARVSIMFVPFMVLPVMEYIDTLELKNWVATVYALGSLILSHVWFPINVDGMEEVMSIETYENFSQFPAQRLFMCTGHWQSHEMYAVFMAITLICGIFIYVGMRKKWFIDNI